MAQRGNISFDAIQEAARQGTGTQFQMAGAGNKTAGNALIYDANGNAIDAGVAPGGAVINHYVAFTAADSQNGVPAAGFNWAASQNSLVNPANLIGSNTVLGVLPFPKSASPVIQGNFFLPAEFVSGSVIGATLYWKAAAAGAVVWSLACAITLPGASLDPTLAVATVTDIAASASVLCVTSTTRTLTGASGILFFSLTRNVADAADTLSVAADLIGIVFKLKMQNT